MAKKNQPPNKVFKAITKTRTETRMKHPKEMVNEIIAWYDFNAVQKVMEQLEMWGDEDRVPTAEELKSKAYILLKNSLNTILDRKSTRLNSSHVSESRMPSSA